MIQNSGSILNIGADYGSGANNSWNHYLGIIDDIRFYNKPFGMEDVYHLYKGDPSLVTYRAPISESLNGQAGSLLKVLSPTPLNFDTVNLTYGHSVTSDDFNFTSVDGMEFSFVGLPEGLSNQTPFLPSDVSGAVAWYRSDLSTVFDLYSETIYERNDSVAIVDQIVAFSFNESNSSLVIDETGNGYHGELFGDASKNISSFGNAISFDWDNDGIVLPKIEYLDSPSTFSYSFWFKRLSDNNESKSSNNVSNILLSQSSIDLSDNIEVGRKGSQVQVYINNGSDHACTNDAKCKYNNEDFLHLGITYGNNLEVYLDGDRTFKSGWSIANLTGDDDSGITSDQNYTWLLSMVLLLKEKSGLSGTGWQITEVSQTHSSRPSTVTGSICQTVFVIMGLHRR